MEAPLDSQVVEPPPQSQAGARQAAKDLFSGAVGGIAQVLIGACARALQWGHQSETRRC